MYMFNSTEWCHIKRTTDNVLQILLQASQWRVKMANTISGADPGFQVRGGALKKIAPSGGRREHFWGISCEKSRFYAKKSYFFRLRREARKFLRYFVWKITILRQKIIFFPILGGAHLKKLPRAEGGAKIFGVFRVKNHDFTPKNLIFSDCGGRREHFWGISCEKSRFYDKKSYFFQF
jgi:hypothetical protein